MNLKGSRNSLRGERARIVDRVRAQKPELASELNAINLGWYTIRNAASDESKAELFIYEEIDPWWGIDANELVMDLAKLDVKNIDVRINSPGGMVWDAIAIFNALLRHPANITVYVDALAASAASVIAMAGDRLVMMPGSQLMIHDAIGGLLWANAKEFKEYGAFLDKQSDNIANMYAARGGGDPKEWRAMMLKETWLFDAEAVALGLADEVYSKPVPPPEEKPDEEDKPDDAPDEEEESDEDEESEEDSESTEDSESDEDDEDDEESIDDLIDKLMNRKHTKETSPFAAKHWKHKSREDAPPPVLSHADFVDSILSGRK